MWESVAPVVSCEVALATLLALARDGAVTVARKDAAAGALTGRGIKVWRYLGRMHPRLADQLAKEVRSQ